MKYSSRFWLYAPLALFLALAAWAMSHWWVLAGALDNKLKAMNGHQAIPGVTLSWASQTISGFPFRIDVVFSDLLVRAEGPRGPLVWHSDHFALHALTYGRAQDIFEAAGHQTLAWTDADGVRHQLNFLPASLRASSIAGARGWRASTWTCWTRAARTATARPSPRAAPNSICAAIPRPMRWT